MTPEDKIVDVVARALMTQIFEQAGIKVQQWGDLFNDTRELWRQRARAAIIAYEEAVGDE